MIIDFSKYKLEILLFILFFYSLIFCNLSKSRVLFIESNDECMEYFGNVPKEYQEVEYIQSTGTQYIDSGLLSGIGYRINCKFYTNSGGGTDQTVIGGPDNTSAGAIYIGLNYSSQFKSIYRGFGDNWYDSSNLLYVNTMYEVESIIRNGLQELTVNGNVVEYYTASLSGTGTNNMTIMTRKNGTQYCYIKLYSMQIYDSSDTMVRDFYPCYRKQDGVIGLYDKVSKTFFTNAGSGTFIKGGDI